MKRGKARRDKAPDTLTKAALGQSWSVGFRNLVNALSRFYVKQRGAADPVRFRVNHMDILFGFLLVITILMLPKIFWELGQLFANWKYKRDCAKLDKIDPRWRQCRVMWWWRD